MTAMDGIEGSFRECRKAGAAAKYDVIAKVVNAELKPQLDKLKIYIHGW